MDSFNTTVEGAPVKFDGFQQVDFSQHCHIRAVKGLVGYLTACLRLQLPRAEPGKVFFKIVSCWAYEIAHVLDEQEIQIAEIPVFESAFDHHSFKMTECAGRDLLDGSTAAGEPRCIIVSRQIAN